MGAVKLSGYQHSSKCLLLCSTEKTHSGLEQHEDEYMITFLDEPSLKVLQ